MPSAPVSRDSRRWWVLALLFLATVINFVDRQSLSIVAPILRKNLNLSARDYGLIVSCFQLGMMVGEFPMGWLMDWKGVRFGMSFAVGWWSIANTLHALAGSLWRFCGLRFMLGTGECGNYSGGMKVVSRWFPAQERAFAVGIFNGGSMIGSILAPPLLVALTLRFSWHAAFVLPGLMGFVWLAAWRLFYRDPARAAEADEEGGPAPTNAELLRLPQTWAVVLCRLLVGPVVQFYIYWLPEYLSSERHMSLGSIGAFAWIPFLFGDVGSIGGGWVAGQLLRPRA